MAFLIPAAMLVAKGIQAVEKKKSASKQFNAKRDAEIASLNLRQKQNEDTRIGRLKLGASMMGNVPATTAGGGVQTHAGLDPELIKQLEIEKKYNYDQTVPTDAGAFDAFVAGLAGNASDVLSRYGGSGSPTGSANPAALPTSMLYNRTAAGPQLPGGGPQNAQLNMIPGAMGDPNGAAPAGGLSWEDLFKLQSQGAE